MKCRADHRRHARFAGLGRGAAALALLAATPAGAVTFVTTFDSSITSMANAAQIETAFNNVAHDYSVSFANPVTVNVTVSWGSVDGLALPANALGASVDPLYGYYAYNDIKSALAATAAGNPSDTALATAVAHLPATTPSGVSQYAVPSAEAKALGLISGDQAAQDGFIGFAGSPSNYTFGATGPIAPGTYDFEGVAAHELSEVLGTISGLYSNAPTYRTPFDLYRYNASGLTFSYGATAYFSINGGATHLQLFNYNKSGGDRGDWETGAFADARNAFISSGRRYNLTGVDLTSLDVLGWTGSNVGDTKVGRANLTAFTVTSSAPEPATWGLLVAGFGLAGASLRRRRQALVRARL